MRQFNISATLGLTNNTFNKNTKEAQYLVTRGTSASISVDLSNRSFTFEQIKQLIILFKQPSGQIIYYNLYDDSELNNHFKHLSGPNYNFVKLTLDEKETNLFEVTENSVIEVEVAFTLNMIANNTTHTFIEKLPCFAVEDSLYSKVIGE